MKPGLDCIGLSVFALVQNSRGEVLLAMHKFTEKKGKDYEDVWAMPGGTVEFGEKVEAALRREIKEETNIDIDDIELVSYNDYFPDRGKHWLALNFTARAIHEEVKNLESDKFKKIAFVDPRKATEPFSKFCQAMLRARGLL